MGLATRKRGLARNGRFLLIIRLFFKIIQNYTALLVDCDDRTEMHSMTLQRSTKTSSLLCSYSVDIDGDLI